MSAPYLPVPELPPGKRYAAGLLVGLVTGVAYAVFGVLGGTAYVVRRMRGQR